MDERVDFHPFSIILCRVVPLFCSLNSGEGPFSDTVVISHQCKSRFKADLELDNHRTLVLSISQEINIVVRALNVAHIRKVL